MGRYFTVTGRVLDGPPTTVERRPERLDRLCEWAFGEEEGDTPESATSASQAPDNLEDRDLIERARNADDGGKFDRLWSGDTSSYQSHSEADQALINKLAFWTAGDRQRIDRLFRKSGLCRDKWVERPDYRRRTISKALEGQTDFYEPSNPSENHRTNGHATSKEDAGVWEKVRSLYESDKKQARVKAADQVIRDLHVTTDRNTGQCYVWDPDSKVLDDGGERRIGEVLVRKLEDHHSRHEQSEITEKVRLLTLQDGFGGEFIPVANGDLFLEDDSVRLEDADPERAPLTRSDAEWDPNADCEFFRRHLRGVMPSEEERETLQEYAGYCLYHWDIPFHKALFMVGPTASGKSTTLTLIRKLLGSVSKLSPQQLVEGRFGAAELEGAWANIRSDISAALLKDIGLFKEVVAGDPIFVERKFQQGYSLRPTAKHLYSANRLPEVSIDDDAFYRRILLVSFPTTIPRDQRVNRAELDKRLEQELDGILRWAVEGLQRVLEQNGFTHDLPPDRTRHRWEEHASSIGRFKAAALNITGTSKDAVAKERVFSAYTRFCQNNGLATETKQQLTRVLKRDPRITDGQRTPPGHSSQVRCYVGIQIKEDAV